nr:peptidoglycan editing factor PgeF [Propionivibrio dicarboxylicus]
MMTTTWSDGACLVPDWPAPAGVRALSTTRHGGFSQGKYSSLNLGDHVGDDPQAVLANRRRLEELVSGTPCWLNQVHGKTVVDAAAFTATENRPDADAGYARQAGVICTVMTADCLPVLLCDDRGLVVAAAHAGWRGLLDGVLEATVAAMSVPGERLLAWFGPAIGPTAFEVGDEVRRAFLARDAGAARAFVPGAVDGKWLADIFLLARQRLTACGVERVFGGNCCTVNDPERFFSYRRDGQTGRMATMVWLDR